MAAREENITKAAQLLHVTQPTLSRQMMQLEKELGATLFTRTNHNVTLTEEGFVFRRRAQDIVSMAEKAKNEVIQNEETMMGLISIGCGELRSVKELAGLMSIFQEKYPKVKFELFSSNNEDIQGRMEQGILDVGLFLEPFNASGYDYVQMHKKEQWGVLIHKDSPLASKGVICPGDLVGTLVTTIHVNTPTQLTLAKWSGKYAAEMDFYANYNVLHNAVIVAGERKGAVVCLSLDCHYDNMKFLPLEPKLEIGSVLAWKNGQIHSRATRAFILCLKEKLGTIEK